ncbi:MAG: VTT domain-containing protein [Pseudomonadales bacterium]|nr:VTT domain-containing protein [Pseudomonadales bacterium]
MIKIFLFLLVVVSALLTIHFDLMSYLTLANIEASRQYLGWWAPLVFLLAFTIGELIHIPSVLWIFFAGIIWPVWLALPIALLSALIAAACSFLVARYFLGETFHQKLPTRLQKLTKKIEQSPLQGIILVRLTTFLHPIMHWILAAAPVNLTTFLVGTLIGIFPLTLAIVLLGDVFLNWWDQYAWYISGLVIFAIAIYALIHFKQKSAEAAN